VFDELVDWIRDARGDEFMRPHPPPPGKGAEVPLDRAPDFVDELDELRATALSEAVARIIDEDESPVMGFRRAYLPGGLLDPAEIEPWIEERLDGWQRRPKDDVRWLLYALPDDTERRERLVPRPSVLCELADLADGLEKRYPVAAAHLAVFILTGGASPPVKPVAVLDAHTCRPTTAGSSVTIRFDPTWTGGQLGRWWTVARPLIMRRGYRRMEPKNYRLVAFAARRPRDETWADTMHRWNKSPIVEECMAQGRPGTRWRYDTWRQFRRDVMRARRQLEQPAVIHDDERV
jgi:hypothetical protein